MLFRADFVRQKHVPGSIETTHGSLSKIIGACWKQLPLEEKRVWEIKAKQEKAAHKLKYPDYRFHPVHNKNKNRDQEKKEKVPVMPEDERRCEDVAQLLLDGKKGEDLARAVRNLDRARSMEKEQQMDAYDLESFAMPIATPAPQYQLPFPFANANTNSTYASYHRRASSVPLPNEWFPSYANTNITLPSIPNFGSRPASPVHSISRCTEANQAFDNLSNPFYPQYTPTNAEFPGLCAPTPQGSQLQFSSFLQSSAQTTPRASLGLGYRRASSAQPMMFRRQSSWTMNSQPLPEFSSFDFVAIQGDARGGGMMECDSSPLPEVEEGLFSNFSFSSNDLTSSFPSTEVDPTAPLDLPSAYEQLPRIDTSYCSPSASSASTTTSSSTSALPAPSIADVLPEMNDMGMSMVPPSSSDSSASSSSSYMGLDGLYASDAMFASGMRLSYALGMHDTLA